MIVLVLCKIYILVVIENNMVLSLRILYWFPVSIFFILNMTFKLIIFILQNFGNAIVWCNRNFVKAGDYFTDLAKNDDKLDMFLDDLKKKQELTKKMAAKKKLGEKK